MNPWTVLGIDPTSDRLTIRRAYAEAVKRHRPDRDPEAYQNVRAAYDQVIALMDASTVAWDGQPDSTSIIQAEVAAFEADDPAYRPPFHMTNSAADTADSAGDREAWQASDAFLNTLSVLLRTGRLGDQASWEALLDSPSLFDLSIRPWLSVQVFEKLGEHCREHPKAPGYSRFRWVARRFNDVFRWDQDELALARMFPPEHMDAVLRAIVGRRAVVTRHTGVTGRWSIMARAVMLMIAATVLLWNIPWPDKRLDAARAHMRAGDFQAAAKTLRSLRQMYPADHEVALLLGISLLEQGDHARAIDMLDAALLLRADDGLSHYFRGRAHRAAGSGLAAKADLVAAAQLLPEFHDVQNQTAWFLATTPDPAVRDGALAVRLATAAVSAARVADYLDTLAAANAEAGNFEAAVTHQQEAIGLLADQTPETVRVGFLLRLDLYREGMPFRAE